MEERKIIDYKSEENKEIIKGLIERVSSLIHSDELEFGEFKSEMYTKSAFKAVVKHVNNDFLNVLEEYPDEIIQIAVFNILKDEKTIRKTVNKTTDNSNRKISSMTQGPISVTYAADSSDTDDVTTSVGLTVSSEIPKSIKDSIKHYVRGYWFGSDIL